MTVNKIYTVWCDGRREIFDNWTHAVLVEDAACGAWVAGDTEADARSNAKAEGWRVGRTLRGRDLCPACDRATTVASSPSDVQLAQSAPSEQSS